MSYKVQVFGQSKNKPKYALLSTQILENEFGDRLTPDTLLRLEFQEGTKCLCDIFQNKDVTIEFFNIKEFSELKSMNYFGLDVKLFTLDQKESNSNPVSKNQLEEGKLISTVRCICDASLNVSLGSKRGFINDNERVSEVTLKVLDKLITIKSPTNGIRDYYVIYDITKNIQVLEAVKDAGIELKKVKKVNLVKFKASPDTPLYKDVDMLQEI